MYNCTNEPGKLDIDYILGCIVIKYYLKITNTDVHGTLYIGIVESQSIGVERQYIAGLWKWAHFQWFLQWFNVASYTIALSSSRLPAHIQTCARLHGHI